MKIDLSCEIVRDLLPIYIDELASPDTVESIEDHLEQCEACNNVYKSMREEGNKNWHNDTSSSEAEKTLFKKINHKVNKKVRVAVIAGIIGIIGVAGSMQLMFNAPLKKVPASQVMVSAAVYPLEELVTEVAQDLSDNTTIISKDDSKNDEVYYSISIPDIPGKITVSKSLMDSNSYLSYISWKSSYLLKDIDLDIQSVDNEQVMYVRGFKTTLLNNKLSGVRTISATLEFQKIDKIIYVEENGTQNILWKNTIK